MSVTYHTHSLSASDFCALHTAVGWDAPSVPAAQKALEHSLVTLCAKDGDKTVGMGRLVGDDALDFYVKNIIVHPQYQGQGIGMRIMEGLLAYVQAHRIPGQLAQVALFTTGKEGFYEKLGFYTRPNKELGPGMVLELR